MKTIKSILIANRGEIALRIQRTARKMGIRTIAVYTQEDAAQAYVKDADEAFLLDGAQLSDTYLNIAAIIQIAKDSRADAIHPGYGFLSENEKFITACNDAHIIFIGPDANAVYTMGNKIEARKTATAAGIPVTPGITGTPEELSEQYAKIGFPILIKAAAGGGGKGMQVVAAQTDLAAALAATSRNAKNFFGDGTVYMEKYIALPRHIEVQILGDQHGNVVHLFERECSVQRRHQKIIEEAPSATLTDEVRNNICNAAVQLAQSIGYYSAGTMEFLLDSNMEFYFLEMNTRIQVEHPVTEMITGIDIVEQQIRIAQGEALPYNQENIRFNGHAIECRIYAEDPEAIFRPSPGKIWYYQEPSLNEHRRMDGMKLQHGDRISGDYDPMIAKLITYGKDREEARFQMLQALETYSIAGIQTNIDFLHGFLNNEHFIKNDFSTNFVDHHLENILTSIQEKKAAINIARIIGAGLITSLEPKRNTQNVWEQVGYWRLFAVLPIKTDDKVYNIEIIALQYPVLTFKFQDTTYTISVKKQQESLSTFLFNNEYFTATIAKITPARFMVKHQGHSFQFRRADILDEYDRFEARQDNRVLSGNITSPIPGKVIKIPIREGQQVQRGDTLLIVEAMKMENNIISHMDGTVTTLNVKEQDKVGTADVLLQLTPIDKKEP